MKKLFLMTLLAGFALSALAFNASRSASGTMKKSSPTTTVMKATAYDKAVSKKNLGPLRGLEDPIDTLYLPPVGSTYSMVFERSDGYFSYYSNFMVPTQLETTWRNITAGNGVNENTSYLWYYFDKYSGETVSTSEDKDLVTFLNGDPAGGYNAPYLTVNGDEEIYYQMDMTMVKGGSLDLENEDMGKVMTRLNFEPFNGGESGLSETYILCKETRSLPSNSRWTQDLLPDFGLTDVDSLAMRGIIQYIPDPGRPYTISRMQAWLDVHVRAGAKITGKIITRDENGYFDFENPFASAEYVFANSTKEQTMQMVEFQFESIDPDGLVSLEPMVVNGDCLLLIDDAYDDPNVLEFTPLCNHWSYNFIKTHRTFDDTYGYALLKTFNNGEETGLTIQEMSGGYFWGSGDDVSTYHLPSNLFIGADIAYPFIYNEDEELDTVNIVVAGENKTIELMADRVFDGWTLSADKDGNEELPEWLTITGEDEIDTYTSGEEYFTGKVTVTISADALPEDMAGRQTEVYFNVPTMSYKITVIQGEAVEPQPAKVYLIGDDPLGGWNPEAPIEMTEDEENAGVFTYTATVEEAKDIYFVFTEGIGSWAEVNGHRYGPTDANQDVVVGEDITTQISTNDQAAYRLAAVAGEYTITFNKNTMTFRVDGEEAPEPDYKLHYGVEGAEWQDATFVPGEGENEGKLVAADVEFAANTEFKVNHGAEWYGGVAEEGESAYLIHYGWCENIPLDLTGSNFHINEAGTYTFLLTIGEESKTLTVLGLVAPAVPGDSNGDGVVDIADVNSVINQMLGKEAMNPACDMNGDNVIDIADVNAVINKMLGK